MHKQIRLRLPIRWRLCTLCHGAEFQILWVAVESGGQKLCMHEETTAYLGSEAQMLHLVWRGTSPGWEEPPCRVLTFWNTSGSGLGRTTEQAENAENALQIYTLKNKRWFPRPRWSIELQYVYNIIMLRFNVTVRLITSRVALAVVNSCRRVLSLMPALGETILYPPPPFFFPPVPLAGVDWFLRARFCCGGMWTRWGSWAMEKISFFHGNLFLVMSCAQCRREDKVQRRRILIAELRKGARRGVDGGAGGDGKSRVMSCSGGSTENVL